MNTRSKVLLAMLATLLFAACGGGVAGEYAGPGGIGGIKFESGHATISGGPVDMQMNYTTEGNKVILQGPGGANVVLTRKPDGSLDTPWGTFTPKH